MKTYQIHPIPALDDNYIWAICQANHAIIIDPGDAKAVQDFLTAGRLDLVAILITHHHHDHTAGVRDLLAAYPDCALYAHRRHGFDDAIAVDEGATFSQMGLDFDVWRTAGHTENHISYLANVDNKTCVFCGDTLFSAGCGRIFTGTIELLFESMSRFVKMADETVFYPTHEYTLANLHFAKAMATDDYQDNIDKAIAKVCQLRQQNRPSLPTTLAHERQINVFLQACDANHAQKLAIKYGLTNHTPLAVFDWLREQKNNF
ncbi:hydroxyacylglutathione hydrolase [Moraxella sp. ZJ142]|uniref:hydroxyacylglutathione hydrolase n=1 Tax=Moraxella marmotae TaxID=3344520 RepID=UPI0035D3E428